MSRLVRRAGVWAGIGFLIVLIGILPEGGMPTLPAPKMMPQAAEASPPLPGSAVHTPARAMATSHGKLQRQVFAYAYGNSSLADPTIGYPAWDLSLVSTIAFFDLTVVCDGRGCDGSFLDDTEWNVWNSSALSGLVGAAHAAGAQVVLSIAIHDSSSSQDAMCGALFYSGNVVQNTVHEVLAKGVDGVNVDYEGYSATCADGQSDSVKLSSFVHQLRSGLDSAQPSRHLQLTVATYADSAEGGGFFDVTTMAPDVDAFFVMAYDLDFSNSAAAGCSQYCLSPVAPVSGYSWNDTRVANEYRAVVPAAKVILGVPLYGRKACVSGGGPNGTPVANQLYAEDYADAITEVQDASAYTVHRDALDPAGQERWDTWAPNHWTSCSGGGAPEMYWDDVTALGLKEDLVNRAGLVGVGFFTAQYAGGEPGFWSSVATHFTTLPGAPTQVTADGEPASATVSWLPPTDNAAGITSFTAVAFPGGQSATVPASQHWATVTGLVNGTSYSFTVYATNGYGNGPSSGDSNAVVPTAAARHLAYFAEGTTDPGFKEFISLANTTSAPGSAVVEYLFGGGGPVAFEAVALAAHARATLDVAQFVGSGHDVSAVVSSAIIGLVVERPMYFAVCLSAFCVNGGDVGTEAQPAREWDFAEGYTGPGFQEYLTILNPQATPATVAVRFLFPWGSNQASVVVPAASRYTLDVNQAVGPNQQVATQITSDQMIVVERPLYFNACPAGLCMNGGDVTGGMLPSTAMSFAEGHTGGGLTEFLDLSNPGALPTTVTVQYVLGAGEGAPVTHMYTVAPGRRLSIHVDEEPGIGTFKDVSVSLTSDHPVVGERAMYFNFTRNGQLQDGGHAAAGSAPARTWYFAEGFTGPGFQTLYSLENPSPTTAANVTIAYMGQGGALAPHVLAIPPTTRVTVDVNQDVGPWQEVSATISSDQPIVAERPMYFNTCDFGPCLDGGSDAPGLAAIP